MNAAEIVVLLRETHNQTLKTRCMRYSGLSGLTGGACALLREERLMLEYEIG